MPTPEQKALLDAFKGKSINEIEEMLARVPAESKVIIDQMLNTDPIPWRPLPGPQTMAMLSQADVVGFGGSAGGGKMLDLATSVPTPSGFTTIGKLEIGDEVFDDQGRACKVTALSPVNFRPESFELMFDDGSKVVACAEHRWLTFSAKELAALTKRAPAWRAKRRKARASRAKETTTLARLRSLAAHNAKLAENATLPPPVGTVRTTREIVDTLRVGAARRANHAIPVAKPTLMPRARRLPLDPYLLGVWLGDGASANGQFTTMDPEIVEAFRNKGFTVTSYDHKQHCAHGLKAKLSKLGVLNDKHVPLMYLRASSRQRLELLKGLMDTDGTVAKHSGAAEFCNTNPRLVEAVRDLVTGLGWKVRVREGRAKLNGKDCGAKWTLKWVASEYVFRLERKRKYQKLSTRRTTQFRYIVRATPVEPRPMRCLAVDSPSRLFLVTENYIPTHNTDLAIGLALTEHRKTFIVRQEATQLTGIIDRLTEIVGSRDGYNANEKIWRLPTRFCRHPKYPHSNVFRLMRQIEFGSVPNPGDETKYQGRPKDLLVVDEATNVREAAVRFLMGWVRTTVPAQRTRTLLTFNPPTSAEGRWVVDFFAPWLDKRHPVPAEPGELRWFAIINGKDVEVEDGRWFMLQGGKKVYEFTRFGPNAVPEDQIIRPQSRTFIPSRIADNPYLVRTGYMATLQSLPEPLRSQMLYGDFDAGMEDDQWQVIPSAWVQAAMARWERKAKKTEMLSVGVDVARGGKDQTVIARRHEGMWFDEPLAHDGASTPDGPSVAGLVVAAVRDLAPIHIDVIGVGSSPYDFLRNMRQQIIGVNVAEATGETDQSGRLFFYNLRSQLWWRMREALDPANNTGIALPPSRRLEADLTAPLWGLSGTKLKVESREDVVKRLGRSPDYASAYILALMATPKTAGFTGKQKAKATMEYDPYANMGR